MDPKKAEAFLIDSHKRDSKFHEANLPYLEKTLNKDKDIEQILDNIVEFLL